MGNKACHSSGTTSDIVAATAPRPVPEWRHRLEQFIEAHVTAERPCPATLATVNKAGVPYARVVAFRGFAQDVNVLQICTNVKSRKFQHENIAEMVFHFMEAHVQVRVRGFLTKVAADCKEEKLVEARNRLWELADEHTRKHAFDANSEHPPDNFGALFIDPEEVEIMEKGIYVRYVPDLRVPGQWLRQRSETT